MTREPASQPYRSILVPFDGSPGSVKALHRAMFLAQQQNAEITALSVDEHTARYAKGVGEVDEEEDLRKSYFEQLRRQAETLAQEHGAKLKIETAVGHAAQTILQFVEEHGADVIVIGHSGHSGVWGTLLGSTTTRVVDRATCDVLVVR